MRTASGAPSSYDDPVVREALQVVRAIVPGYDPVDCEPLKRGKSDVFAVNGPSGCPPLVAKRARADTIAIEHKILTWLGTAPFPTVLARGATKASEADRAWLVSEYAVGEPYDRSSPTHRRLAGTWLGDLHVWSASVATPNLPARDSEYHRNVVRSSGTTLADALAGGTALTVHDRSTIRALGEMGRNVLDRWSDVDALLGVLPATLVHSGMAEKNIRIVPDPRRPAVLAFDWEQAGWGCPAADLSMVDLESYAVRARLRIDLPEARLLAAVGELLWCFAGVPGERPNLLGSWPHRAVGKLEAYLDRVRTAMCVFDAGTQS
jgi:hypothetical protein